MKEIVDKLNFIGIKNQDKVRDVLKDKDDCFGEQYSKSSDKCKRCRCPVLYDGQIYLMKEVCKEVCAGREKPINVRKVGSNEVMEMLNKNYSPYDMLKEIIGDQRDWETIKEGRTILSRRISALKKKNIPTPKLPTTREFYENGNISDSSR